MSVTHVAPWKVTRRPRLWDCRICSSTRFGHEGLVQRAGRALRPFVVFETKLGVYNMQELGPPCSDLIGTRRCGAFITATPPSLRSDDTLRPLWQQSYLGKTFGDNLDNIVRPSQEIPGASPSCISRGNLGQPLRKSDQTCDLFTNLRPSLPLQVINSEI